MPLHQQAGSASLFTSDNRTTTLDNPATILMAQTPQIDPVSVDAQPNPSSLLFLETPALDPSRCPKTHHLIITTAQGVYSWNRNGITELFRSGSQSIVAAEKAPDGSGMLAVADSKVVFVRDVEKGVERSYRLKESEV